MAELTQDRLKELFEYDPDTGIFTRLISLGNQKAGTPCLSKKNGYIKIQIDGVPYYAHRLAFLYMEGMIPIIVDHINQIKDDNRWSNLRESTDSSNKANITRKSNNTSGYKNVSWNINANKWQVQVQKNGRNHSGGYFESMKDAVESANTLRLHLFGEFATIEVYK